MNMIVAVILLVIAGVLTYFGRKNAGQAGIYNLYVDASRPSELADGVPGFFRGTVTAVGGQQPLVTPYSKQPCVLFWSVVEDRMKTQDSSGSTSYHWQKTSESQPNSVLFAVQNSEGYVLVNANGADVHESQSQQTDIQPQVVEGGGALGGALNVLGGLNGNQRRITEHYVPIGAQYSVGGISLEQNQIKTFSQDSRYPLVLTTSPKSELVKSEKRTSLGLYAAGAACVAAAGVAFVLIKN